MSWTFYKNVSDRTFMMDVFNLTWKTFGKHLSQTVQDLLVDDKFANVTLVCDDQRQLRAHKFILSACSPVFRSVLMNNSTETNPLIILRGIKYQDMRDILQFMYQGETSVTKKRMKDFMKAAEELEVKIISKKHRAKKDKAPEIVDIDVDDDNAKSKSDEGPGVTTKDDHGRVETESILSEENPSNDSLENTVDEQTVETLEENVKTEMSVEDLVELAFGSNILDNDFGVPSFDSTEEDRKSHSSDISTENDTFHEVKIKDENSKKRYVKKEKLAIVKETGTMNATVRRRVVTGEEFPCTECYYVGNLKRNLTNHMRLAHPAQYAQEESLSFSCPDCSYVGTKKCNLKSHIRMVHTPYRRTGIKK